MSGRSALVGVVAVFAGLSVSAYGQPPPVLISCGGTESGGGGVLLYEYHVQNVGGGPITKFVVGTDNLNPAAYAAWTQPPGWAWALVPGGVWTDRVKTPHGVIAPPPPYWLTAGLIVWTAGPAGAPILPGQTGLFGFNNQHPAEDVEWNVSWAGGGWGTNWAVPVAGPVAPPPAVFTDGPVHAPVPEPATLGLMTLGLMLCCGRRR